MKLSSILVLTAFSMLPLSSTNAQTAAPVMPPILHSLQPSHPRLLASKTTWSTLQTRRREDATLDAFLKRGELEARALLDVPPIAYKKDGRRLLSVSRTVLRRTLLLAMQFHLTGDRALARRAQAEMLSAASFVDWNPSHFLDVGEMTMALAFGTDWLFDELEPDARKTIANAIIEKGLRPGLKDAGWQNSTNNWNSVVLSGLSLGALAVAEDEPLLAAQILEKARKFNVNGLKPYEPAGVYPEGASYWGYGTTFQVILLDALQSALGTDWNLSQNPGFLQTADSVLQIMGPSGTFFNFSDGHDRTSLEGGNYWFAKHLNRPELVRFERESLRKYSDLTRPARPLSESERTLPLIALWWPATFEAAPTLPLHWYGPGPNPLASFRTSWTNPDAMFLSLKGGSASLSHAHMDAGSFVFEADGVRWARDLGMQSYAELEAKKIDLWNGKQDGGRWSVFRLNNFSHNTLTINDQLHRVEGHAKITHFSDDPEDAGAIVDLSAVFQGQAKRVTRGFAFRAGKHALIRDEIEGLKAGDSVRFAWLTKAEITVSGAGKTATLAQNGQQLHVDLLGSGDARFEAIFAQGPHPEYDAPNPDTQLLIVNFTAPASGNLDYAVKLRPGSAPETAEPLSQRALKNWPQAPTVEPTTRSTTNGTAIK